MKKFYINLFLLLAISLQSNSQSVLASVGRTNTPNTISLWIKPDATNPSAVISSFQFNLAYDNTLYTDPPPTLTFSNNAFASQAVTWIYDTPWQDPTFPQWTNFSILNAQAGYTGNFVAGIEQEILRVTVTPAPGAAPFDVEKLMLLTLPDGGSNVNGMFYLTGTFNTDGSNLYYNHLGIGSYNHINAFSFTPDPNFGNPAGNAPSMSMFATAPMAIGDLQLDGTCLNENANLQWTIISAPEELLQFEVQRTLNNGQFETVQRTEILTSVNKYNTTITNSGNNHYRINQISKNGTSHFSNVLALNCAQEQKVVNIYPNPMKDYLIIQTNHKANSVSFYNSNGQLVKQHTTKHSVEKIDLHNFIKGLYLVTVRNTDGVFNQKILKED